MTRLTLVALATFAGTACSYRFDTLAPAPPHPPPVIESVTPTSGFAGDTITISGANLVLDEGTTTVTFPGGIAATVTMSSGSSLTITVPDLVGNGPLQVSTLGGQASSPAFTFLGPGEPRFNTFANVLGFQVQPQVAVITDSGAVVTSGADPIGLGQEIILRAARGTGAAPVFTRTCEIPTPADLSQYQHVFALGETVITISGNAMTQWSAPHMPSAASEWTASDFGTCTSASDPNWQILLAAPQGVGSDQLLVVLLSEPGSNVNNGAWSSYCAAAAGPWCASFRQSGFARVAPEATSLKQVSSLNLPSSTTSLSVTPVLAVSSDGSWATLVTPDGSGVGFSPNGSAPDVSFSGISSVVAAVPSPLNDHGSVIAEPDGTLVHVDSLGNASALTGPGPVPSQLLAFWTPASNTPPLAPQNNSVVAIFPGVAALTTLTLSDTPDGLPVTITNMQLPFVPSGISANPSGTAVIWNAQSTEVAELSLWDQVIDWTSNLQFVAQGGIPYNGGVLLNFVSPAGYLVGYDTNNLTAPAVSVPTPSFDVAVAGNASRQVIWGFTPTAALGGDVTFSGTPAINTSGTKFLPQAGQQVLGIASADAADYFVLEDSGTSAVTLSSADQSASVALGSGTPVLSAPSPTQSTVYVLAGGTLFAVDTGSFAATAQLDVAAALNTPGWTGETLHIGRDGSSAVITDGQHILIVSLASMQITTTFPTNVDGAAISPDGRYLYFVLPSPLVGQESLARFDLTAQTVEPLFQLPALGPAQVYSGEPMPLTTYNLFFSLDGAHLFVDAQDSGEVLNVQ